MLKLNTPSKIILLLLIVSCSNAATDLSAVSMPFIKNVGQAPDHVSYYTHTPKAEIFVDAKNAINYSFNIKKHTVVIREHLLNGHPKVSMHKNLPTQINILKGNNKSYKNIPNSAEISFGEVWKGIDVKLVSRPGNVEKLFTLKPQANVDLIKLSLQGIKTLEISDSGQLSMQTALGKVAFTKPIAWQTINNIRSPVEVSYTSNKKQYGFKLGKYDHTKELIIDPLLAASYVGGSSDEIMGSIHINGNNEIIVTGSTSSADFPSTVGVFSSTTAGSYDFFAMKVSADMSTLIASTYYGGNSVDQVQKVAFDANDNIYFGGQSRSTDFPIPAMPYVPYQQLEDANGSIFIAGLSADLTTPLGATYIGGGIVDMLRDIDIAPNGNVYVTGFTNSTDYPYTVGAFETAGKGIIISAFNPDLSTLIASTRLGEGDGFSITIDTDGTVFVGGNKNGNQVYDTTPGVYSEMPINSLGFQIYLAHLSADLSTLLTATFISFGGTGEIIVTPNNDLLINAKTSSFPISSNAFDTSPATTNNATIFKIDKAMTTLGDSTYIDLVDNDAILLESDGNILVFGSTATQDFPGGNNPTDPMNTGYHGGSSDFAIARFNPNMTQVTHSSYIGGSNREFHGFGLAKDNLGNVIVAGRTESTDVATSTNAFDSTYGGQIDIIVLKATSDLNFGPFVDGIFCDSFESPNGNGVCL